jgi:hypothetical protein
MNDGDPDSGIRHFERLLALPESLRAIGVSLYHHGWHSLVMSSWSLTAGTRYQSFLFTWDGREGSISVQGPFHAGHEFGSRSPSVANERLGLGPSVDPFQYVEHFFHSRANA